MELPSNTNDLGDAGVPHRAPETALLPEGFDYWAFISYSHRDEGLVKWLHNALETYKVPRQIVGQEVSYGKVPPRAYPLFRDRDEFRGAADLARETKEALRLSHHLIVICSPDAARSKWVNAEIIAFKAMGREDRVLCLIVGGEPHASERPDGGDSECFPPALRYRVDSLGELTGERVEPVAADLRKGKDGKVNAKLKLLAGLLDVRYDELKQREMQRRFRQRVRLYTGLALLLLLSLSGYLMAADAGFNLPGGERFRAFLDRHEASRFRAVNDLPEIQRAVSSLRSDYLEILKQRRTESGGVLTNINPSAAEWVDVWSYSQAASAILGAPEASQADKRNSLSLLDAPFAPGVAVESRGKRYGWVGLEDKQNTQAEPAFWTAIALITVLRQPGLLDEQERQRTVERLHYTEEVLKLYRPSPSGGWNTFVDQENPSLHNTYATALALLALLEAKRAGLPWEGSVERRDALLGAAAGWLIETYDAEAATPGWRETGDSRYEIYDGLTLQIYAELLRAEAEAGSKIPEEILRQIPLHLTRCLGRDLNIPDESGEFSADIKDHRGQSYNATAADTFLWYPWAVSCAALWLERTQKFPAPTEERVRVQRSLDYLVIEIGRQAVEKGRASDWTYNAAETLYALALPRASSE